MDSALRWGSRPPHHLADFECTLWCKGSRTYALALMDTEQSVCLRVSHDTMCRTECFQLNGCCWQMLIPAQRHHCGVMLQRCWLPLLRCWIPGAPLQTWRSGAEAAWLEMRQAWDSSGSHLQPWRRTKKPDLCSCWCCFQQQLCGPVSGSWAGSGKN